MSDSFKVFAQYLLPKQALTAFAGWVASRQRGSVTDAALLRRVLADGIDVVFHLVSRPGGAAEEQYSLGYQVNLLASLELLDQLRSQPGAPVLVGGVRSRLVGRVSMDMLAVDLTPVLAAGRHAGLGAEVVLWGRSASGAVLGADEVAHAAGTIGYELMCAVAQRVPSGPGWTGPVRTGPNWQWRCGRRGRAG